jgi:monothiol glutaredoxin
MENNQEKEMFELFEKHISENDIVLYMKGTASAPMCGFSATVVAILNKLGAKFFDVNVMEDSAIREYIKKFSDWPTIPQLYIKGDFIGGCDIAKEMFANGELSELLTEHKLI